MTKIFLTMQETTSVIEKLYAVYYQNKYIKFIQHCTLKKVIDSIHGAVVITVKTFIKRFNCDERFGNLHQAIP